MFLSYDFDFETKLCTVRLTNDTFVLDFTNESFDNKTDPGFIDLDDLAEMWHETILEMVIADRMKKLNYSKQDIAVSIAKIGILISKKAKKAKDTLTFEIIFLSHDNRLAIKSKKDPFWQMYRSIIMTMWQK